MDMATYRVLPEHPNVNQQLGFLCSFKDPSNCHPDMHRHQYHEIFLTQDDGVIHLINGKEIVLKSNTLVLVRPDDLHSYKFAEGSNAKFINLAFSSSIAQELFDYIGNSIPLDTMLSQEFPPMAFLSKHDTQRIRSRFEYINTINRSDIQRISLEFKILLFEMFTRHFSQFTAETSNDIPAWLDDVCRSMQRDKNFIHGIPKMLELSGKSPEHLSRSMKKYYGITPTAFIENLRLNYTVNMLINSSMPILDICFESGFQNVSWFNTLFKKKFGMSPSKFRNENRTNEIINI